MKRSILVSAAVAAGIAIGALVAVPLANSLAQETPPAPAKNGADEKPAKAEGEELVAVTMFAPEIKARIAELEKALPGASDPLEKRRIEHELRELRDAIARDGDNAMIMRLQPAATGSAPASAGGPVAMRPRPLVEAAYPESYSISATSMGVILLDSRNGDTWILRESKELGTAWHPLPRIADRFHVVSSRTGRLDGVMEDGTERVRRERQLVQMMEDIQKELERIRVAPREEGR